MVAVTIEDLFGLDEVIHRRWSIGAGAGDVAMAALEREMARWVRVRGSKDFFIFF